MPLRKLFPLYILLILALLGKMAYYRFSCNNSNKDVIIIDYFFYVV